VVGIVAFLAFGLLTIAWSFSVPIGSSPDEPHHVVKAAAVVRGEWLGSNPPTARNIAVMLVHVPRTYSRLVGNFTCYRLHPDVSSGCAPKVPADPEIVPTFTHVGRYPPLYYLLVGWPTLLSTAESTIRWMRVISCLIDSAIIGFMFMLVRRFRMGAGIVVGLCCALTPVVVYMDSTVQPNGLEVTLALLIGVTILGLSRHVARHPVARDEPKAGNPGGSPGGSPADPDLEPALPPRMLVNTLGAGSSLLVLVRGLSPLWLACLGIVGLILIPWPSWWSWIRTKLFLAWTAVFGVVAVVALAWIFKAKTLDIQPWAPFRLKNLLGGNLHPSLLHEVHLVLAHMPWFVEQMVGALTHDAQPPIGAYIGAFVLLGLLIVVGLWRGTARQRVAIAFASAATFLIPICLAAPRIHVDGLNWQGRYILPFAVDLVLVSAVAAFRKRPPATGAATSPPASSPAPSRRRAVRIAVVAVAGALLIQGVEYWSVLRRYTVSETGPHDLLRLSHPQWSPVLPVQFLAAAVPALLLVVGLLLVRLLRRADDDDVATASTATGSLAPA
jgi:hypothetical protein